MSSRLTYYPSARVRLLIRLEDYGAPGTPKPPKRPVVNRRGTKDTGQDLKVVEQNGILILTGPGMHPDEKAGPHSQTTSQDGLTHVVDGIVPIDAQHDRNGIRVADQLKVTINYTDLPIDPRVIRACGVEYFLGTLPPDEWDRGSRGEMRQSATAQGLALPYNMVPDTFIDTQGRTRSNNRFQGWADEIAFGLPKDGGSTLELECTDNTRLLIDIDAPPGLTIDPNTRIDKAIANYLAAFPQLRGLAVQYVPNVDASKIPNLKDSLNRNSYPPKLGPSAQGSTKITVWDYLTDVAGTIGHTIRMEGVFIIIQRAKTLYASGFNVRPDDPFQGRQLPDGTLLTNRTYVYGDNVLEFEMRRKFTRATPTNIEVRSYLPQRKKTLVVRYPEKVDRKVKHMPGDNADQKYKVIYIDGIGDKATLRVVAQTYYEADGRKEVEGTVLTTNLSSFGGNNIDPDMLDALAGDTVDVLTAPPGEGTDVNTVVVDASESAAAQRLITLGFHPDFAAAYAKSYGSIGFPHTFKVRNSSSSWSNDTGVDIQIAIINYIEVRADADLPEGEELRVTPSDVSAPEIVRIEDTPLP